MAKSYIHELGDRLSNGFTADNLPKHIKEIAPIMYNDGSNNFNSIQGALNGKAESSHTHGNIQNGGTLQTNDITIANGDKLVVTDSSDSSKVARASIAFDGSTTTKALTPKGTFEAFAKSGDITTAIQALDVSSVGGDGKYISAISETDGKISAAATTMDTTPTANSTKAVTSGGIKTVLDGKQDSLPTSGTASSTYAINISGNAGSATKATQDSDGNAINATYFKSSGNVTLVSGTATKIGTQNGTDVKLTLPTIPAAANNGALQLQLNGGTASSKFTANQSGNSTLAFSTGSTAGTFKVDSTEIAIAGFTKVESSSTNGNIKINGTETAVYTHPTTAGNKHIPSGGSSGQFLGYDSAGTAKWVSNPNTDTKQRIVASDSKTYLTGVTTAPTSSNQDLTGVANANVYATAGQLHATAFDVNSKCTLQFNTTTNALDFVFV